MKILKYVFLLLLLSFVSFSVFIATQKGTFTVERSQFIHASKINTFNYVNDLQNWENFITLIKEGVKREARISKKTQGKGALYIWKSGEGNGWIQTNSIKKNNSISQKMIIDESEFNTTWFFKDSLGGTKVTLVAKGEMNFSYKIYTALHGGAKRIIGNLLDNSLINLDKYLDFEINTFTIKTTGIVQKLGTPYIKQTFTCKIGSVINNSKIVFSKLHSFCEQNSIERNGKPFIIYHSYDAQNNLATISICVPIKKAIITSEGSDILSDELKPFKAVKTTLYGDYSHSSEVIKKSKAYINQKVITPSSNFSHIDVFTIGKNETKYPSKWKTESYFPVQSKKITPKPIVEETTPTGVESATSEL